MIPENSIDNLEGSCSIQLTKTKMPVDELRSKSLVNADNAPAHGVHLDTATH